VSLKGGVDPARKQLKWKWSGGLLALTQGDFGTPTATTAYALCVYDDIAGVPTLKSGLSVAPGGMCGATPCWAALGTKGWKYRHPIGNADAVTQIKLLGGEAGKPRLQIKAKGAALPLPAPFSGTQFLAQNPSTVLQLHTSSPVACWSSSFEAASTKKNIATQFKAKTP
jgi:hypothetical protein